MNLFRITKSNFISPEKVEILNIRDLKHIVKVLRKKVNDKIYFTDLDFIYFAQIVEIKKKSIILKVLSKEQIERTKRINIRLFLSLVKISVFENILVSAVQLGVSELYPIFSEYSQVKNIDKKRFQRWQLLVEESCKQSFNYYGMKIAKPVSFNMIIKTIDGTKVLFHPKDGNFLSSVLKQKSNDLKKINIFIGPEGGFSEKEIILARENDCNIIKLPYNILKTEVAVIAGISNIIFYCKEILKNGDL